MEISTPSEPSRENRRSASASASASGEMVAGYTGTQQRATYTCIGDTVNLAARLEGHTKIAQQTVLIDAATRAALPASVRIEALGPVPFRGKAEDVEVYAVPPRTQT